MRDFHLPGRSAVFSNLGMCATSHPLAAKVAVQMLESGGNAADGAIAAAVLLGLCEPQMTGLGGDCFVLVKPAGSEDVLALNGSGRAPVGLTAAALRKQGLKTVPVHSADAVTVPGAVDAFCSLAKKHGKLGLGNVLAPAIYYAQAGVPVAPRVAFDWNVAQGALQGDARSFYLIDNRAPKTGQLFKAPQQAEVLKRIAAEGRNGFYTGEVAKDMVGSLQALGGSHTMADFENTTCTWGAPISGTYKAVELIEHPPNGQGATAILMANILSHFDLPDLAPFGANRAHIEAEATKLAYDARNRFMADPEATQRLEHMLAPETALKLAKLIRLDQAMKAPKKRSESVHKETVYLTVVDKDRMAVSMICSIFHSFGSGLASAKFGINFQNRGAGFTLEKNHPNELGPNKRPMHTIIPAMLKKQNQVTHSFGVMGGQYQSCGHARFVSNLVDFDMELQEAIDAPRCFFDAGTLNVERGYSDTVKQELADLGHNITVPVGPIGGAQAIDLRSNADVLQGASDPRKDGCALGY